MGSVQTHLAGFAVLGLWLGIGQGRTPLTPARLCSAQPKYADSGFFKAAVDIYMHDIIAKTKEESKAQLKCYAGSAGAVIYDNGVLSSCENKADVLNLRDYDWDFQSAWRTDLMKQRRKEVADGCYCTHESNCFYPSLPLNPGHLIKIIKLEGQMKKAAKNAGFQAAKEVALKA